MVFFSCCLDTACNRKRPDVGLDPDFGLAQQITAAALNSFLKNMELKPWRSAASTSEPNVAAGSSAGSSGVRIARTEGSCLNYAMLYLLDLPSAQSKKG